MTLLELYLRQDVLVLEEKFAVTPLPEKAVHASHNDDGQWFIGNYPPDKVLASARGAYGGDLVAQLIVAAWETVDDREAFSPHSLHSHFVAASLLLTPLEWLVLSNSAGRTFANRLVRAYQLDTKKLVYVATISFARNNLLSTRIAQYHGGQTAQKPFYFQRKPMPWFYKYRDVLDSMPSAVHTHGTMEHIAPPEVFKAEPSIDLECAGNTELGVFFRVVDDLAKCRDPARAKIVDLAYILDSVFLGSFVRALGLPLSLLPNKHAYTHFFKVSLDHVVHFHDTDFDPTQWMFCDFHYCKMGNDRILCQVYYYTLQGKLIATVNQEALAYVPDVLVDDAHKLHLKQPSKL